MFDIFGYPVIAAVRDRKQLAAACDSAVETIFLLKGDILTAKEDVDRARAGGKKVLLHADLLDGLGRDESAVRFLAGSVRPDGIISTRPALVKCAAAEGLFTVLRVFVLDSQSFETGLANLEKSRCDAAEVLPGLMPSVIARFAATGKKVISGGLVRTVEEVNAGLAAGAAAMSVGSETLWRIPRGVFVSNT